MSKKYEITELTPFVIEGKMLQLNVIGKENGGPAKRLGYVGVAPGEWFSPLCFFDMEHAGDVQKQIERIKASESTRQTAVEKVS